MLVSHFKINHRREKVIMENLKLEEIPTSTKFKKQIDDYVEVMDSEEVSQEVPQEAHEEEVETTYETGSLPDLISNPGNLPNLSPETDHALKNLKIFATSLPELIPETDHVLKNLKLFDALSKDCDCKCCKRDLKLTEYETMKTYTIAFLQDLLKHEIKLFDEINKFFLNVREADRGIQHRNSLKKMKIRSDNLLNQLKFGKCNST